MDSNLDASRDLEERSMEEEEEEGEEKKRGGGEEDISMEFLLNAAQSIDVGSDR